MKFDAIKKRILNNYKLLVSTKIIGGLASAITLLIIARFLGVYFFGIFAMIISSVEILNILISFRVWDTTVKFIGDNATNKQNISSYISFSTMGNPVPLGILCGLFFGKQFGVFIFSYFSVKFKYAEIPTNSNWRT